MMLSTEEALAQIEAKERARGPGQKTEIKAAIRAYILKHNREPEAFPVSEVFNYRVPEMEEMIREISEEIAQERRPKPSGR